MSRRVAAALLVTLLAAGPAAAHITPPVVLASDRDALLDLLAGARRFFVREVRLSAAERDAIQRRAGWTPDEDFYRFYLGRDADGRLVAAAVFVTEFTVHGPVRVAVGLDADGRVRGARVVELTEETYPWVKPLLDRHLEREWVGRDSRARFAAALKGYNVIGLFHGHFHGSGYYRWQGYDVYDVGSPKHGAKDFFVVHVTDERLTVCSWNYEARPGWWWAHSKRINKAAERLGRGEMLKVWPHPGTAFPLPLIPHPMTDDGH